MRVPETQKIKYVQLETSKICFDCMTWIRSGEWVEQRPSQVFPSVNVTSHIDKERCDKILKEKRR